MPNGSRDNVKVGNWDDNDARRDVVETVAEDDEERADYEVSTKVARVDARIDARSGNGAKRDVSEVAGVDKRLPPEARPAKRRLQERRKLIVRIIPL
jgi:hypothetical protein